MGNHRDLMVWQKAMTLAEQVYRATSVFPREEMYGLVSQMRRSAVSVPSNIAEGEGRGGKDGRRFLDIAYGSLLELETQIELSQRLGFLQGEGFSELQVAAGEVGKMLNGLKRTRDQVLGARRQESSRARATTLIPES